MLKTTLAAAASLLVLAAPQNSFAQGTPADAAKTAAEAVVDAVTAPAEAPKPKRSFPAINFDQSVQPENVWLLDLSNGERVAIRLMPEWAPAHIARIKQLTSQNFYDGVIFHRVIDGFMAQGGDPTGTGQGGSAMPDLAEEFNPMPHVRGSVSMARATGEDSANSQFFIVFYPRFSLDKRYTNFGRVISNMAAVDAINKGEPPANPTRIVQASLASQGKPRPAPGQAPRIQTEVTLDDLSAPIS
ncbi:MAG: peptidylprolyl isomerase [Marinomonas sp.]